MKTASRATRLAVIAALAALAGCVSPLVEIPEYLSARPRRSIYPVGYAWTAEEEIFVELVNNWGESVSVPVSKTTVTVSPDRDFTYSGAKTVTVTYQNKSDHFTIAVGDTGGGGGGSGGGNNGPTLIIPW
jgi:hypothetical protein